VTLRHKNNLPQNNVRTPHSSAARARVFQGPVAGFRGMLLHVGANRVVVFDLDPFSVPKGFS
jgi:hypothetical protein